MKAPAAFALASMIMAIISMITETWFFVWYFVGFFTASFAIGMVSDPKNQSSSKQNQEERV